MSEVKFVVRMTPGLHRKLRRRAKARSTSMNSVIVNLIDQAVSNPDPVLESLARIEKELKKTAFQKYFEKPLVRSR